jgi:cytoskeleton protein RodZ
MSEVVEISGNTAGALLRAARQAAGLHIEALAVALKVPVSKLQALESDHYDELLDTVFVRALASSVCRALKIDVAPVLALLPQSQTPKLDADSAGLNAPVKAYVAKSSMSSSPGFSGTASKSVSLVVLLLLIGALVMLFFPRQQDAVVASVSPVGNAAPTSEASAAPDAAGQVAPMPVVAPVATAVVVAAPVAPATPEVVPVAGTATGPVVIPGATAMTSAALVAPVVAADAVPAVAAAPVGVLVLRARSESWVQVRDATGATVLQRSLPAGESVSVSGTLPLAVVVGRVDATEVLVRGKPFDLTAVSRENVARFEVK